MPYIPHTPESLLPRSDSKNAATTCRGITSNGRPCRRALAASSPSSFGISSGSGGGTSGNVLGGEVTGFCWQHKDQSPALPARADGTDPEASGPPLRRRTSQDTLIERLGLLRVGTKVKSKKRRRNGEDYRPRQSSRYPKRPPEGGSTMSNTRPERQSPRPSLLSLLCCVAVDPRDGPTRIPKSETVQISRLNPPQTQRLPTGARRTSGPTRSQNHNVESPLTASQPPLRPFLPRDPSSHTSTLLALIPTHLSPQITSFLLVELAKPISQSDEEGYIYMFRLSPGNELGPDAGSLSKSLDETSKTGRRASGQNGGSRANGRSLQEDDRGKILLKIGRTSNIQRRLSEWSKQCDHNLSLVRYYPYVSSPSSASRPLSNPASRPPNPQQSGSQLPQIPRKVPHATRVERLIHLELSELRMKRDCAVCGREHREWFDVKGGIKGVRAVDEVLKRWVWWSERNG